MYGVSALLDLSSCVLIIDLIPIHLMLFVVDSYFRDAAYKLAPTPTSIPPPPGNDSLHLL